MLSKIIKAFKINTKNNSLGILTEVMYVAVMLLFSLLICFIIGIWS